MAVKADKPTWVTAGSKDYEAATRVTGESQLRENPYDNPLSTPLDDDFWKKVGYKGEIRAKDPSNGSVGNSLTPDASKYLADNKIQMGTIQTPQGYWTAALREGKIVGGTSRFISSDEKAFDLASSALISLGTAGMGLGAGIGKAIGLSGTLGSAVGTGIANAGMAAAQGAKGGSILKAGLAGAVGPAVGAIPGVSTLPTFAKAAIGGAASGAVSGGNLQSALLGAVTAGAGSAAGSGAASLGANPQMAAIIRSFLQQAIKGKLQPKPTGKG